jgi:hypothetical protein
MKIRGFFGPHGAPMVAARLSRNDGREPVTVRFVLDTGAYRSLLSLREIHRLGVSVHELRRSVGTAIVFGGRAQFYSLKDVTITFDTDRGERHEHLAEVLTAIGPATGEHRKRPAVLSLLGRDFLDRFAIFIDKRVGVVLLTDEEIVRVERRQATAPADAEPGRLQERTLETVEEPGP